MNTLAKQRVAKAIIQTLAQPQPQVGAGIIGTVANLFGLGKKRKARRRKKVGGAKRKRKVVRKRK